MRVGVGVDVGLKLRVRSWGELGELWLGDADTVPTSLLDTSPVEVTASPEDEEASWCGSPSAK